jgi:hypothetical protein
MRQKHYLCVNEVLDSTNHFLGVTAMKSETLDTTVLTTKSLEVVELRRKVDAGGTILKFNDGVEAIVLPMDSLEELSCAFGSDELLALVKSGAAEMLQGKAKPLDLK